MAFEGFVNTSPYAAGPFLLADEQGADLLVLIAKGTWRIEGRDRLALEEEQAPIDPVGSYHGKPDASSLRNAPEADFIKPSTDIALFGHAHAPQGKPVAKLDVSLRVGSVRKIVRVFGDRQWRRFLLWRSISSPKAFRTMPLVYERAFGGTDDTPSNPKHEERETRNPVGVGLVARGSQRKGAAALPNLEDPKKPIRSPRHRPAPAGFGFIAAHWAPRLAYAGTYDAEWQKNRMPLLPEDFDRRFFHAAHPDLVTPEYLLGGEPVEIVNASPRGRLAFTLPEEAPEGAVMMKDGTRHAVAMNLDTVRIDTDEHRVSLIWRGHLPVQRQVHDIRWAKVQLATAGVPA